MQPVFKTCWNRDCAQFECKLRPAICSWSDRNWIAFTTGHSCRFKQPNTHFPTPLFCNLVFIIDPNYPWEVHTVKTGHECRIEILSWEPNSGTRLLTADANGIIKIWKMVDQCINKWTPQHIINLGDSISITTWMTLPNKYAIDLNQVGCSKDIFSKYPMIQRQVYADNSGGQQNAFLCLTIGGILHLVTLADDDSHTVTSKRLGNIKTQIWKSDLILKNSNKLLVVTIPITNQTYVELFNISIKRESLDISVEVLPCIVPFPTSGNIVGVVTHVFCILKESSDQVIVITETAANSFIHQYDLKKVAIIPHIYFKRMPQSQPQSAVASVCLHTITLPRSRLLPVVTKLVAINQGLCQENTITSKLIIIDGDHIMSIYSLQSCTLQSKTDLADFFGSDRTLDAVMLSPCEQALFCIDSDGDCYMGTILNNDMCDEQQTKQNTCMLLEYNLLEGYIPWDIAISMQYKTRELQEECMQMFCESFYSLPGDVQSQLRLAYLSTKATLFGMLHDFVGKLECFHAMVLQNINLFLFAQTTENGLDFMENLQKSLAGSKEWSITALYDSMTVSEEISLKIFSNHNNMPLIQWFIDYSIHFSRLITSNYVGWKKLTHYFDILTLADSRLLLALMYAAIVHDPTSLIHIIHVSALPLVDVIIKLFTLFSKMFLYLQGDSAIDIVQDDLLFLSVPLMYLSLPSTDYREGILSQHRNMDACEFEFQLLQENWTLIKQSALQNPLAFGTETACNGTRQIFDSINLAPCSLVIGEVVKSCTHCGGLTIMANKKPRVKNTSWFDQWQDLCICGGNWKEVRWHDG